jgi:hypothetical protein
VTGKVRDEKRWPDAVSISETAPRYPDGIAENAGDGRTGQKAERYPRLGLLQLAKLVDGKNDYRHGAREYCRQTRIDRIDVGKKHLVETCCHVDSEFRAALVVLAIARLSWNGRISR